MGAPRVKTRGPNLNRTAPAWSKRSLPLYTRIRNIIENAFFWAPIFNHFWYLFRVCSRKVSKRDPGHAPKCQRDAKMSPKVTKIAPNGAQLDPEGPPKNPESVQMQPQGLPETQKHIQMHPKVQKCRHGCHNQAPSHPPSEKNTTRPPNVLRRHEV